MSRCTNRVPQIPEIDESEDHDIDIALKTGTNVKNIVFPSHPPRLNGVTGEIINQSTPTRPQYTSDGFAIPTPRQPKIGNGVLQNNTNKDNSETPPQQKMMKNLPQNVLMAISAASLVLLSFVNTNSFGVTAGK